MQLDPKLIAFELVNFVILVAILRRFLFRPVRETLERRRAELAERTTALEEREAANRALEADYRGRLAGLEQEAERLRAAARKEGREEAERLLEAGRQALDEARERAEAEQGERARRALRELRPRLLQLAVSGARQLAGELSDAELVARFASRGAAELLTLGAAPAALSVAHSPLPGGATGPLEQALRRVLGPEVELRLEVDPELVAGVRLRAGDLEVEASAGSSLAGWAEDLTPS